MNAHPFSLPADPLIGYFLPMGEVKSTSGATSYLEAKPSSTMDASDYFRSLAEEWKHDTGHLSLISKRVSHPSYKRILRMGNAAVPLILEELQRRPGHWFHALITLADDNPVPADFDGTVEDAAAIWVNWGVDQGLIRR